MIFSAKNWPGAERGIVVLKRQERDFEEGYRAAWVEEKRYS